MSSYILTSNDGSVVGPYADLLSAQNAAQVLLDAYIATNPTNLSGQHTATVYAAVLTKTFSRNSGGILLSSSTQMIDNIWTITNMAVP